MFQKPQLYLLLVVRLFIIPLLFMGVLLLLTTEFMEMKMAMLIVVACPTGSNVAVYAQLYNSDYTYAVETVIMTTLFSIITMPLIVQIAESIQLVMIKFNEVGSLEMFHKQGVTL